MKGVSLWQSGGGSARKGASLWQHGGWKRKERRRLSGANLRAPGREAQEVFPLLGVELRQDLGPQDHAVSSHPPLNTPTFTHPHTDTTSPPGPP